MGITVDDAYSPGRTDALHGCLDPFGVAQISGEPGGPAIVDPGLEQLKRNDVRHGRAVGGQPVQAAQSVFPPGPGVQERELGERGAGQLDGVGEQVWSAGRHGGRPGHQGGRTEGDGAIEVRSAAHHPRRQPLRAQPGPGAPARHPQNVTGDLPQSPVRVTKAEARLVFRNTSRLWPESDVTFREESGRRGSGRRLDPVRRPSAQSGAVPSRSAPFGRPPWPTQIHLK